MSAPSEGILSRDMAQSIPCSSHEFVEEEQVKKNQDQTRQCQEHSGKDLDIFCKKCNQTICSYCLLFGQHKRHLCLPMESYLMECKQKILQHAKVLLGEVEILRSSIGSLGHMITRVEEADERYVNEITQSVKQVAKVLKSRKEELIKRSGQIRREKIASLQKQQQVIQVYAAQLEKTSQAFEVKANSLKPSDEIESIGTFECVANEMKAKVPTLTPCCSEAVDSSTDVSGLVSMISHTGRIRNIETKIPLETIWSTIMYLTVALVIVAIGFMMTSKPIDSKASPGLMMNSKPADIKSPDCHSPNAHGIINWIGTNAGKAPYKNPIESGNITVRYSSLHPMKPGNDINVIGSRGDGYCTTLSIPYSWISFDFQNFHIRPLRYSIKHGGRANVMRHWQLQGSHDQVNWVSLRKHVNDTTIPKGDPCKVGMWNINDPHQSYRYLRILQTGPTSDGTHYLTLGGFEVYGYVNYKGNSAPQKL
jgi:hypothetical protein